MPIVRCSDQYNNSLEGFYKDVANGDHPAGHSGGAAMLSLIEAINQTFIHTQLFGLTSLYRLIILPEDNWQVPWYVTIGAGSEKEYYFEYLVPAPESPWQDARMRGDASSVAEAMQYLAIAMIKSGGWPGNKELQHLYNNIPGHGTYCQEFTLWLEFEEIDPGNWSKDNEFCNVLVELQDGRKYGLNVWTYQYLQTAVEEETAKGRGAYLTPPDLFVKEMTRECIEQAIKELLQLGELDKMLKR